MDFQSVLVAWIFNPRCIRATAGRTKSCLVLAALLIFGLHTASAQLPYHRLDRATPNSAQTAATNQTVTIKISGAELDLAERLDTDIPGATTTKVDDSTYKLVLPPNAKTGLYDLRLVGRYGLSAPRRFALDARPHQRQQEPKTDAPPPHALDTVILGEAKASEHSTIAFSAKAGTPIAADCYATRIDSRLHAALTLIAPNGKRIASTRNDIGDDPVLTATAPIDGV